MGSAAGFEFWSFGHAGVDLFFVISGFVIYLVHWRDIAKPSRLRNFLRRRLTRVYPPLWIVTTGVLAGALITAHAVHAEKLRLPFILKSYLLWPIQQSLPLVPPAWTLSHEVKFYLIFASAIALPRRLSAFLLAIVLTGSILVGAYELWGSLQLPFWASFCLSPYNLEFAGGVLAAVILLNWTVTPARALAALGVSLWAVAAFNDQSLYAPDAAQVVRYALPSVLIVLGVAARDARVPVFRGPLLGFIGNASYSVYLVHLPVIIVAVRAAKARHLQPNTLVLTLVAITATIAGFMFHATVERPLTRLLATRASAGTPQVPRDRSSPE